MKDPKIKTKVVHSQSKPAWNVIGTLLGDKYKIARCPYVVDERNPHITDRERAEAREHAEFISFCFNNSDAISTIGILTLDERINLASEDQLRGRVPDKDGLYQGDLGDLSPYTDIMIHYWLDRHAIPRIIYKTV